MSTPTSIDLSVIITAHAEGILLHKTLASVRQSLKLCDKAGITSEVIIHIDNPTKATQEYVAANKAHLADAQIFTNSFGDLGLSRNFAVTKASGTYVTFIDADDLVSEQWYSRAYKFLESHKHGDYIAHTEYTVEFGSADSLVIKHGEINQATDTLLSVFANRWNSIIMAPRSLLLDEPYTANSPGYGYEDWNLNCRFIKRGIHNVLIPETAIFVRRKDAASEWLRQKLSRSVLRANPLFNFKDIRALKLTDTTDTTSNDARVILSPSAAEATRERLGFALQRVPQVERYARKVYHKVQHIKQKSVAAQQGAPRVPSWLSKEWRAMHHIEKQVFPTDQLMAHVTVYDSLTPDHYKTAVAFKQMIDHTSHDTYDYILFVPWLIKGGADLFAINYANTIQRLHPNKHVLVVSTMARDSDRISLLKNVDFIPFGTIAHGLSQDIQYRLLEQLIENSGAQTLHIINSELAYDFVESHSHYMQATDKKLILTSFSQSTDGSGRLFGYSHTHVPKVYDLAACITTDNSAVVRMWTQEYGFNPKKIQIHHQTITAPEIQVPDRPIQAGALRVLWAARLSPEKQPALVAEIGRLVKDTNIQIDMYGHPDVGFDTSFLQRLPANVQYKGSFNDYFSLPLHEYDAYLYTSLFDGMPNSILEAATAHLPIVSAAVGGVPDFIADKESGLLVPTLDSAQEYAMALRYYAEHPDALTAYAQKLHEKLQTEHSEATYLTSVKAMLKAIDY